MHAQPRPILPPDAEAVVVAVAITVTVIQVDVASSNYAEGVESTSRAAHQTAMLHQPLLQCSRVPAALRI